MEMRIRHEVPLPKQEQENDFTAEEKQFFEQGEKGNYFTEEEKAFFDQANAEQKVEDTQHAEELRAQLEVLPGGKEDNNEWDDEQPTVKTVRPTEDFNASEKAFFASAPSEAAVEDFHEVRRPSLLDRLKNLFRRP